MNDTRQDELDRASIVILQSRLMVNTITSTLAGVFNLLMIIAVCWLMLVVINPAIERAAEESMINQAEIRENRRLIQKNQEAVDRYWHELEDHRKVIRRLTDILDDAARKQAAKAKKEGGP